MPRLFVALDFPEKIRIEFRGLMARLKSEFPEARWVRSEGMHVTLKFVGRVDEEKAASIGTALKEVFVTQPVEMDFRGVGFFPNERRPRIFWCGVEASPNLAELAGKIDGALAPLGVKIESRPYVPHLTLARLPSSTGAAGLVRAASEWKSHDFGATRETEYYLFESILKPFGAEYKRLHTYSFVKGEA